MATRPTTELDFDLLKADIINYIKTNPTFTDYNFEGSALNAIVDILAFNTHNNAYYANMLHNENFIDTAQKRSSVVSKAKELGYTPTSATCSTAIIDINLINVPVNTQLILNRGITFNSYNDNGSYTFSVLEDSVATIVDGVTKFADIKIVDGVRTQNYFKVNTLSNVRSIFTIPNKNIDTKTLKVFVRDSISSIGKVEYILAENVYELTPESKVYFIQESYDGYFQIYFGENVLGIQPENLNIIDVDYFVVENFELSNKCRTFTFDGTISTATVSVLTKQVSFGGSIAEDINSIRINAVKSNSAKERTVTTADYSLKLAENFSYIKSSSVWGGEDNDPPVYGKVFLSLQPIDGYTISNEIKNNEILPAIRKTSMLTVKPEFVDPSYTCVYFVTKLKFNPYKTTNTQSIVEYSVKNIIKDYIQLNSKFNAVYLESTLIKNILDSDPGIISVNLTKKVGFNINPLPGVVTKYIKSINNTIVSGSIKSNVFQSFIGDTVANVYIKEVISSSTEAVSNTISLGLYDSLGSLISTIGTVNLNTGYFDFTLSVYNYLSADSRINIKFYLESDDILTKRNQIIILDSTIQTSYIVEDNIVLTEIYAK